jgi:hypothetical protein
MTAQEAAQRAERVSIGGQKIIRWRTYWPEGARCARINPATGEITGKGPVLGLTNQVLVAWWRIKQAYPGLTDHQLLQRGFVKPKGVA